MADPSDGVVFIATGEAYVRAARVAARTVRRSMPGIAVDIFTDLSDGTIEEFDRVHRIENPHRRSKVDCLHRTRFENTIYLDSDVRVVADVSDLFRLMVRFDLAIAHAHARGRRQTNETWRTEIPEAFCQLNGGVFVYRRSPAMLRLLEAWSSGFHEAGFRKDQVVLRELVWTSDIQVFVLPPEYNIRYDKYLNVWEPAEATPKILHMRIFKNAPDASVDFDEAAFFERKAQVASKPLLKRLFRRS